MTDVTIDSLAALIQDQDALRRALKKDETIALLKGQFKPGRTPFIHQVTFPNGAQLRLKFYNTVKKLFNTKGVELIGKESFLSYLEVTGIPASGKGWYFTTDVNQVVWHPSKTKATEKHNANLAALVEFSTALGIELDDGAWATSYTENY